MCKGRYFSAIPLQVMDSRILSFPYFSANVQRINSLYIGPFINNGSKQQRG